MPDREQVRENCHRLNAVKTVKRRNIWIDRIVPATACAAIVIVAALIIGRYRWNITPLISGELTSPTQIEPNTQPPNNGAVYHLMDVSELVWNGPSGAVPFWFWFSNRLMEFAKNETGINLNNGVRWDKGASFTSSEVEMALQIVINEPVLPHGDYTTEQSLLVDEATDKIIAYKTAYYFFDKSTKEVQYSFSVFYMAIDDFKPNSFAQSENIVLVDGISRVNGFPVVSYSPGRISHVRCLTYLENGIAIVVEAEARPVLTGNGEVDEAESLEKYEQLDKALVNMMEALIK